MISHIAQQKDRVKDALKKGKISGDGHAVGELSILLHELDRLVEIWEKSTALP
jgi:hypothetical protein